MSIEINKALVHWWLDLWNQHNVDALGDLVSPDYVHHTSDGTDRSFAQFKEGFAAVLAIFPDMHYVVTHMLAEDDMVALYFTATGTHRGAFFGTPPTGNTVRFLGVYHCRIADGTIVEDWDVVDALPELHHLGLCLAWQAK